MSASRSPLHGLMHRSMIALLVAGMPQRTDALDDPFAGLAPVSDTQLEAYRGGFENSRGIQFSFAVERAIVVNGELVSTTRIVLNDLSPLLKGGMPSAEVIASARTIVQNGIGNAVTPLTTPAPAASAREGSPATTAANGAAAAPATPVAASAPVTTVTPLAPANAPPIAAAPAVASPATAGAPTASTVTTGPPATGTAAAASSTAAAPPPVVPAGVQPPPPTLANGAPATAASATAAAPSAAPGTLYVQMNAAGQTILIPNASAIVTAVQNTVNDQIIQARTTIDATLNSLSLLRSSAFAESLRMQALDGIGRR